MSENGFEQSEFDVNHFRAHNTICALQRFAEEVQSRTAVRALKTVVDDRNTQFKGGYVDQAPEYFTERYLIEPVLEQLALNPWPRPVDLVKDERNRPDHRLLQVESDCLAISESKALNRERSQRKASDDIRDYLQDETFLKTLQRESVRYSLGIATDGLKWRLFVRDVREDVLMEAGECSIVDPVKIVLQNAHSEVAPNQDWIPEARRQVANSLVATFSQENIRATIVGSLSS